MNKQRKNRIEFNKSTRCNGNNIMWRQSIKRFHFRLMWFFFVYLCQISCARFSLAFNWIDLFEFYSFMLAFIHNHLCSWKKNNRKKFDQIKTLRLILLVAVNENIEISQKLDSVHQNNSGKQTVDFLAPVCVIGDRSVLGSLLWKFTRNDRQAYFQFIFCINCDLKMFDYFNVHWKIPIQNAE